MNGISRIVTSGAVVLTILFGLSACKKPGASLKSDLEEAGYQLTTADWFRASQGNDVAAMKSFVAAKFAIDSRNEAGDSALHAAATGGARAAAEFLLDRKISVDDRGAKQRTPLMAAVIADQTEMVSWLLNQGADPKLKDDEGFNPLMLAVREGSSGAVGELAPYTREDLDAALLLAALVGRADVIDSLTNFGASIYARMDDGRTPLMIAAENGHTAAVELLIDIGANRLTLDPNGKTAADLATEAGHPEIAAILSREPQLDEFKLESPTEIATAMDTFIDSPSNAAPLKKSSPSNPKPNVAAQSRAPSLYLGGQSLSSAVIPQVSKSSKAAAASFAMPPLVMRHYREREIPIRVKSVQGETAILQIAGAKLREVKIKSGDRIPGSNLVVVRVQRKMESSKMSVDQAAEVSVVEVRDTSTGTSRQWIAGVPSTGHDPIALVEDSATGQRYLATPGQRFTSSEGTEYIISEVRPNQLVIQEAASGAVQTIPLRGPRG